MNPAAYKFAAATMETSGSSNSSNGGPVSPSATQEYCLKWNNHQSTIINVMDTLLEEESLVDVTLSADGQLIRAHRIILSACSPYFRVSDFFFFDPRFSIVLSVRM